jgi:hypothetical protein
MFVDEVVEIRVGKSCMFVEDGVCWLSGVEGGVENRVSRSCMVVEDGVCWLSGDTPIIVSGSWSRLSGATVVLVGSRFVVAEEADEVGEGSKALTVIASIVFGDASMVE